ncbi:MAG: hypothetical protein QGH51_07180 [Planctomycetota bacterium]|jgi:aspartate carbamoyltransferase catalytic subunit|nr:hypothetical protein [Planctomycetota bacterium]
MALLPVLEGLHSAESFHKAFLGAFFERAREIETHPASFENALQGRIIATVFEEASTRTRLSFEAAAHRLGAQVISVADSKSTSHAKGESLLDAARMVGSYADLIVWRHPRDGATRVISQATNIPVVNAGDGRLGHPTQTLVDLYTLHREWGSLEGKTVGVMGDLRNGRTARSLLWGLTLAGARVVLLPAPGLDWEVGFETRVLERSGLRCREVAHPLFKEWTGSERARLLEPKGLLQGSLFRDQVPRVDRLDALYLTRLQVERGAEASKGAYPGIRMRQMKDPLLEECLVLHPLPRLAEVPVELDEDPRARYFEQARMGPLVRQALFLGMLRPDSWPLPDLAPMPSGNPEHRLGPCPNKGCITLQEGIRVPWRVCGRKNRHFLCAYCDSKLMAEYVGCHSSKRVHPIHSQEVMKIRPENLCPFISRDDALQDGYQWGG